MQKDLSRLGRLGSLADAFHTWFSFIAYLLVTPNFNTSCVSLIKKSSANVWEFLSSIWVGIGFFEWYFHFISSHHYDH